MCQSSESDVRKCENCKYHDDFTWVCFNGNSENRANFTDNCDFCKEWEKMEEVRIKDISKEKIETMFQLLHEENKAIMITLLSICCYPKDYDETVKDMKENWDELYEKVQNM